MAYSLEAEVRAASPFKNDTLIPGSYMDDRIEEADGIIDGKIGDAYSLPLSETPPLIRMASIKIACYLIFMDQNTNIEVMPGVDIIDEFNRQLELLEQIRTRKIKLYDTNGDELAVSDVILPAFYPNDTSSADTATDSTAPKITMNKQF